MRPKSRRCGRPPFCRCRLRHSKLPLQAAEPGSVVVHCVADDTARSPDMICELQTTAKKVGFELRFTKAAPRSSGRTRARSMQRAPKHGAGRGDGEHVRVFGAQLHMQADQTWTAFHLEQLLWRTRRSLHAKILLMHVSVYVSFAWASGTRHWTRGEVQRIKAM